MTQQIYISDECWSIIVTAKMQLYKCFVWLQNEKVTDANSLREIIISDLLEKPSPSSAASLLYQNEVSELCENYFNSIYTHF
jgi:hypothetical protein